MEERCSANSPRRILSFSKNRKANVSFPDVDQLGVSGDHGPKLSEVYGFVGSITTLVFTDELQFKRQKGSQLLPVYSAAIFIIWAYAPDQWLHSIGIFYYPSRYWALAVPTYAMVTIVLAMMFYIGLNFMATPPPTSMNSMFDEFSREPVSGILSTEEDDDEQPIEPMCDIGINQINEIMFNNLKHR